MIRIDIEAIRKSALLCTLAALIPIFGHSVFYQAGTYPEEGKLALGQDLCGLATAPGRILLITTPWSPLAPDATYHGSHTQFELYVVTMVASAVGWLGIFLLLGWLLRVVRRGVAKGVPAKS